jgi:hypothetical protein
MHTHITRETQTDCVFRLHRNSSQASPPKVKGLVCVWSAALHTLRAAQVPTAGDPGKGMMGSSAPLPGLKLQQQYAEAANATSTVPQRQKRKDDTRTDAAAAEKCAPSRRAFLTRGEGIRLAAPHWLSMCDYLYSMCDYLSLLSLSLSPSSHSEAALSGSHTPEGRPGFSRGPLSVCAQKHCARLTERAFRKR